MHGIFDTLHGIASCLCACLWAPAASVTLSRRESSVFEIGVRHVVPATTYGWGHGGHGVLSTWSEAFTETARSNQDIPHGFLGVRSLPC
jgi:hypothetical protein